MAELRMDQYDDEEETGQGLFGGSNPGMSYYRSNHEDPYITLNAVDKASDSEAEDDELRESDFVILSARNEDDVSHLEVSSTPENADLPSSIEAPQLSCPGHWFYVGPCLISCRLRAGPKPAKLRSRMIARRISAFQGAHGLISP